MRFFVIRTHASRAQFPADQQLAPSVAKTDTFQNSITLEICDVYGRVMGRHVPIRAASHGCLVTICFAPLSLGTLPFDESDRIDAGTGSAGQKIEQWMVLMLRARSSVG